MTKIFNCIPSKEVEKDWSHTAAIKAKVVDIDTNPKESIDLRRKWWGIGDQKDTGSCVGWACTDGLLRWHFVKSELIDKKDKLSVRFIWMSAKETDEFISKPTTFIESSGSSLKASLDIARNYGCVKNELLPFSNKYLYKQEEDVFYTLASQLRISSYHNIGIDINEWKKWLSSEGVILARLDVDHNFKNLSKDNNKLNTYASGQVLGGHAVTIVGYTKEDFFIIRNSWGKSWGENGFGYLSSVYVQSAFTEAYVIVV